ncbi:MAG TPA: hypothetical protein VNR37_08970 [Microbacteriaceae bacterium]|nr:hypothetical protein [Microbacteriaceae bacterium]
MIALLIALAALGVWGSLATATVVARDGYRAVPTDWSRIPG